MAAHTTRSMQASTGAVTPAPDVRGRIGVNHPAPGLMLEAEWRTAVSEGVDVAVTRQALKGATRADYVAMAARAPEAAAILANAGAGIIAAAITGATMAAIDMLWIPCSNVRTIGLIGEVVTAASCPGVSSIQALLEVALAHPRSAG